MTASSRTTIPRSVRVDVAAPTPWIARGEVSIVHLGQSALVLADRRGHLVITSGAFGLAPGGIELLPADLLRLRSELKTGRTACSHWMPEVVEMVDLTLPPVHVDPAALAVLGNALVGGQQVGTFDPARQRAAAVPLVRSATDGESVAVALLGLIGAGPGSTPAGDDVIVGVLAGLRATGRDDAAALIANGLLDLLPRTTSASGLYLSAAAEGRFAERVHLLVRGLEDRDAALAAARSAARWGATSGIDLLAGIVAAATHSSALRRIA